MGPHSFKCGKLRKPVLKRFCCSRFNGAALFQVRKARQSQTHGCHRTSLQWGRTLSSAESFFRCQGSYLTSILQWGRTLSSAERIVCCVCLIPIRFLQWGRTLSSAESFISNHIDACALSPFNGAALFQVRKANNASSFARSSFFFNGAALFQVRKACRRSGDPTDKRIFNGAALFQVRKAQGDIRRRQGGFPFNGAALFQVRKAILRRLHFLKNFSFNGAALFQVRKVQFVFPLLFSPHPLQWGRTLSSAESSLLLCFQRRRVVPSMGPHSFKCGKSFIGSR